MIIDDCRITNESSEVLERYSVDDTRKTESCTGVVLDHTGDVLSLSDGEIILIGDSGKTKNIVVYYPEYNIGFNYSNLKNVSDDLSVGDKVWDGEVIGQSEDYVRFEYLNDTANPFPVRVGNTTLYKYDPVPVLENGVDTLSYFNPATTAEVVTDDSTFNLHHPEVTPI